MLILSRACFFSGGPDNMELQPSTTSYTLNIGESLDPVLCSATCVPTCSFTWARDTQTISNSGTLQLSIQNKNQRGTYSCTATRGTAITETRSIAVYVRCKFAIFSTTHTTAVCSLDTKTVIWRNTILCVCMSKYIWRSKFIFKIFFIYPN